MDVVSKAAVLLGAVLVVAAGIGSRWFVGASPTRRERATIVAAAALGAVLLVAGSVGEVAVVVTRILRGRFDLELFVDVLGSTRQGGAVLLRCALALPLAAWAAFPLGRRATERAAFAAGAVALLATISWVSHSGTMGMLGFAGDLAHLVATTSWSGALLALAVLPVWSPGPRLRSLVGGVSRVGLAAVLTLLATGTYMATLHMYAPEALVTSDYGRSLLVKLALVGVVLLLAAVNRWLLVPLLERFERSGPLRSSVRAETVILAFVLLATAILATRPPAHEAAPPSPPAGAVHDHMPAEAADEGDHGGH
jgi:putative copper export protein